MEHISLAIVSDNKEYSKALGMAVLNICNDFAIKIFSCGEFFKEKKSFYFSDSDEIFSNKFDLILWDGEEAEHFYGEKIILLSGDPAKAIKNYQEKKFCLYKYSSARANVSALFEIYSFLTGKRAINLNKKEVRLLTFSSYAGGNGCTTLAMAVGQEMCRFQGNRVLYLTFEEIESTGEFMDNNAGMKGVGIYLYHLFKKQKGYPFMESYVLHDDFGLEAFTPTSGRNPLRNLNQEEFNIFMASLIDCGRYDAIIMDIGNCLSELGLWCMEIAERICLISYGRTGSKREVQYLQHLICCCGENILDKIIKVQNMVTKSSTNDATNFVNDEILETSVCINRYKMFPSKGGIQRIILEGGFGENIKKLTEKMTDPIM